MAEGKLPRAVASGGPVPPGGEDRVQPRRAAIVVGAVAAAFALALLYAVTPPTEALRWIGGPKDDLERYGGLHLVWQPPADVDPRVLAGLERQGDAYVVRAPGVREAEVAATAERLAGTGRLEFHVVREVPEMRDIVRVLELPMKKQEPVDAEVDQWHPEAGGGAITDFYLRGSSRAAIAGALAEAGRRGWHLPPGMHIAYERIDRVERDETVWRTYVLDDEIALDGRDIAHAYGGYDTYTNRPVVNLEFSRIGAARFGDVTASIVGHKLATVLDGDVKSAPIINGPIRGGRAMINMGGADPRTQERDRDALLSILGAGGGLPRGGHIVEASYVEPMHIAIKLLLVRLVLAGIAGLVAGGIAWAAVRLLRPYRRRATRLAGSERIHTRVAWTALAVALSVFGASIVLPGVEPIELARFSRNGPSVFGAEMFSVFALGIMPVITSHVIVEIVASIVPRWRRLRDTGRRKLGTATAVVTLIVATVQSYFIAVYLESASAGGGFELVAHPGLKFRMFVVATLVAGTMSLAWLASVITRRGIGNGYLVLFVASWLLHLPSRLSPLGWAEIALLVIACVAIAVVYLVVASWRVRGPRSVDIPVPAAGIAPLSDAGGLMSLLSTLAACGILMPYDFERWVGRLHYETIGFALVAGMSVVWTFAFARPGRRGKELAKAELAAPTGEMWLRATVLSIVALVAMRAIARVAIRADYTLASFVDPVMVMLAAATIADVIAEARDRRRGLVPCWPLHDPLLADVVHDRLTAAGIDNHIQARRARSLLWIFGSYAPMYVLVPADRADDAAKLVGELFE